MWHLGCVTAACLTSAGYDVIAYDDDPNTIAKLRRGQPPIGEPGLADAIQREVNRDRLHFEDDPAAVGCADIVWVTWDTPIDDEDRSDAAAVVDRIARLFPHLRQGAMVLVSSQLPVGSVADLERRCAFSNAGRDISFACVPENLRLGKAIEAFTRPDRIVAGVRRTADRERITSLLAPFTDRIEWMGVESAEMTKHAINAFLASSVAFMNEIASLCERVGADAHDVSRGLQSEARIGPRSYLSPGGAFAGGTLARDLVSLEELASATGQPLRMIGSIRDSNEIHRRWAGRRLREELGSLRGRTVAVWGLTYKPGTDTLRRSSAVELCEALFAEGANVRAYDPAVTALPEHLARRMTLAPDAVDAARGADAVVVATEWPEFRDVAANRLVTNGRALLVLDAGRFLAGSLGDEPNIRYVSVGRPR